MRATFNFLIGTWHGTGIGRAGTCLVERTYQFILNGKFLQVKNKSTYLPQEKNPKGEVHEDWGIVSHDVVRKLFVFRQFHMEGFVNEYILRNRPPDSKTFVFITENIENLPLGWRARETYTVINANEFTESFELAVPSKQFEVYSECHLNRIS